MITIDLNDVFTNVGIGDVEDVFSQLLVVNAPLGRVLVDIASAYMDNNNGTTPAQIEQTWIEHGLRTVHGMLRN